MFIYYILLHLQKSLHFIIILFIVYYNFIYKKRGKIYFILSEFSDLWTYKKRNPKSLNKNLLI